MKIAVAFIQNKTILTVLVFIIILNLLQYQQINAIFLDNLAMSSALKILSREELQSNINVAYLSSIANALSLRTANDFQTQIRNIVIGNLYWKIGNKELAKGYWDKAGIEPEFFVKKIEAIELPSGLDYVNRAILLAPDRSELLYYKGLHFEKNGDTIAAKQWYDMAEEYDNWVNLVFGFDVFYEYGQTLYENQQLEESEKAFDIAIRFAKKIPVDDIRKVAEAHRKLGVIAQQSGRIAEAKSHFLQAIELYPEDYWNYFSLGLIAESEKASEKTVFDYFNYAHLIAPQDLLAYVYPASHYLGQNRLDKWLYFCEATPGYLQHQQQWIDVCRTAN